MAELNDRCFCYFTTAMLVPICMALTWRLHTKLYKFWWNNFPNNARMNYRTVLNLGEFVYISIIFHIPAFELIYWTVTIFIFDGVTLQTSHCRNRTMCSIETRKTCFLFHLEIPRRKKRKQTFLLRSSKCKLKIIKVRLRPYTTVRW